MPLKNRVDPTGALHAISARGTLMGNRGNLCRAGTEGPQVQRYANGQRWIICALWFQDQRLPLATLHNNTQLFFLDEATALAAGHRPCARCRRDAYRQFLQAWSTGAASGALRLSADIVDAQLQQERNLYVGHDRTLAMPLAQVPDGAIVRWQHQPALVFAGWLQQWSFAGYTPVKRIATAADAAEVPVLTPGSTLRALRSGYRAQIHPTAHSGR